jgi:hypothetical protein
VTNRRKGGKTRKKTARQRRLAEARAGAAERILSIPRPTFTPVCQAIKVELMAQAAESRRDAAKN